MTWKTLEEAEAEARRFLRRAETLRQARQGTVSYVGDYHPRESGAVRRASMDLTRALAKLRKGE